MQVTSGAPCDQHGSSKSCSARDSMGKSGWQGPGPGTHLLGDLQLEVLLYGVQEAALAAGVEHALLNAALVPRHGVDKHCGGRGGMAR